jgi:hypothetical protein
MVLPKQDCEGELDQSEYLSEKVSILFRKVG